MERAIPWGCQPPGWLFISHELSPLEEPLAKTMGGVKPEVAHRTRRDLERTSIVEQVAVHLAQG